MNFIALATILIDPQSALIAGAVVPVLMVKLIRLQPEVESSNAIKIGAAWGAGYAVAVSYMYFNYPDWMFGYMLDTTTFPVKAFWPVFLAACTFSGAASAGVGAYLVRNDRLGMAVLCILASIATLLVVWIPHSHGYMHVGTFAEYRAGTAAAFPGPPSAQFGMNLAGGLIGVPSVLMIVFIIRKSLRA